MLLADRKIADDPLELTSRVNTSQVAEAKGRLDKTFHGIVDLWSAVGNRKHAVDVVLATNMISRYHPTDASRNPTFSKKSGFLIMWVYTGATQPTVQK
jgi:hypothetical protein